MEHLNIIYKDFIDREKRLGHISESNVEILHILDLHNRNKKNINKKYKDYMQYDWDIFRTNALSTVNIMPILVFSNNFMSIHMYGIHDYQEYKKRYDNKTRWCTTVRERYDEYMDYVNIFVITTVYGTLYQFTTNDHELYDAGDRMISHRFSSMILTDDIIEHLYINNHIVIDPCAILEMSIYNRCSRKLPEIESFLSLKDESLEPLRDNLMNYIFYLMLIGQCGKYYCNMGYGDLDSLIDVREHIPLTKDNYKRWPFPLTLDDKISLIGLIGIDKTLEYIRYEHNNIEDTITLHDMGLITDDDIIRYYGNYMVITMKMTGKNIKAEVFLEYKKLLELGNNVEYCGTELPYIHLHKYYNVPIEQRDISDGTLLHFRPEERYTDEQIKNAEYILLCEGMDIKYIEHIIDLIGIKISTYTNIREVYNAQFIDYIRDHSPTDYIMFKYSNNLDINDEYIRDYLKKHKLHRELKNKYKIDDIINHVIFRDILECNYTKEDLNIILGQEIAQYL